MTPDFGTAFDLYDNGVTRIVIYDSSRVFSLDRLNDPAAAARIDRFMREHPTARMGVFRRPPDKEDKEVTS